MDYEIPPDIYKIIQNQIDSGNYQNSDDVLRSALKLVKFPNDVLNRWNKTNEIAIEQSKRGLSKHLDEQAVLDRLRSRLASQLPGDY